MAERQIKDTNNKLFLVLSITSELTFTIALPVVALTLFGNYLDEKFHYVFFFVLIGGIVGVLLGVFGVYKSAKRIQDRIYNKSQK